MSIVVFGSINMDLVARTPRLPSPGETLTGHTFQTFPGGKGANQAVACARLGAKTFMVGRVGSDVFGGRLKAELATAGVDHTNVEIDTEVSSGVALIAVEESAENMIIVVPGANGQVGEDDLLRLESVLARSKILLLQLEIPLEMVVAAAKMAKEKGVITILDPAPAQSLPETIYSLIDFITPNEKEAAFLVGFPVEDQEGAARAVQVLEARGVGQAIIKMGSKGAFTFIDAEERFFDAIPVTAIDSVAAGDAFNGALAVALSEGKSAEEAVQWGVAGGALSVTKEGAQPAMPDRKDLLAILEKNN
jgi:ribokinase